LVRAAEALPRDTVIDGEIVIADTEGNSDFGALQVRPQRWQTRSGQGSEERPAVLLTFDALRDAGVDLTGRPLRDRRASLERLLQRHQTCFELIAQTDDVAEPCATIEGRFLRRVHSPAGHRRT
jgi:bifunctional non-homologous end joining protein LigD